MNRGELYAKLAIVSAAGIAVVLSSCTETHVSAEPKPTPAAPTQIGPSLPGQPSLNCLTLVEHVGGDRTIFVDPVPGLTKSYYSTRQVSATTVLVEEEKTPNGEVLGEKYLPMPTEPVQAGDRISPEYIFKDPDLKADVGIFLRRLESPGRVAVNFIACPVQDRNNVTT